MCAAAVVLVGCSVQESTRKGGLVPPTGPAVTATSPAPAVVTVASVPISEPAESAEGAAESAPRTSESAAEQSSESVAAPTVTADAPAATADNTIPPPTDPDSPPTEPDLPSTEPDPPPTEPDLPATEPDPPPTEPVPPPTVPDPAAGVREVLAAAEPPEGFDEGVLGVTGPAGTRLWPVVIADSPQSRQRGLMGVTDFAALGGYAAMVFIFEGETSGAFWMRDTPLPLRITFVAADGSVVSGTDMVPCLPPTHSGDCERYFPDGPYRIAIEHPLGPAFDIGLAAAEFVEVAVE